MNLDNKEVYERELRLLQKLSTKRLHSFIGELYQTRFEDQDIEVDAYYRLASHVLNRRMESRQKLVFHLKSLVVSLLLISYF